MTVQSLPLEEESQKPSPSPELVEGPATADAVGGLSRKLLHNSILPTIKGAPSNMMSAELQAAQDDWPKLSNVVFVPQAESEYKRLVTVLDDLIDEVGEDDNHPLASLMEVIGVLIEKYEDEHVPELMDV